MLAAPPASGVSAVPRKIERSVASELDIHVILDNYATHKHPAVRAWLDKHPRVHFHFIPTSSSWLNLVERFFSELTTRQLKRLAVTSVDQLIEAINHYIDRRNDNPHPLSGPPLHNPSSPRSAKRKRLWLHSTSWHFEGTRTRGPDRPGHLLRAEHFHDPAPLPSPALCSPVGGAPRAALCGDRADLLGAHNGPFRERDRAFPRR